MTEDLIPENNGKKPYEEVFVSDEKIDAGHQASPTSPELEKEREIVDSEQYSSGRIFAKIMIMTFSFALIVIGTVLAVLLSDKSITEGDKQKKYFSSISSEQEKYSNSILKRNEKNKNPYALREADLLAKDEEKDRMQAAAFDIAHPEEYIRDSSQTSGIAETPGQKEKEGKPDGIDRRFSRKNKSVASGGQTIPKKNPGSLNEKFAENGDDIQLRPWNREQQLVKKILLASMGLLVIASFLSISRMAGFVSITASLLSLIGCMSAAAFALMIITKYQQINLGGMWLSVAGGGFAGSSLSLLAGCAVRFNSKNEIMAYLGSHLRMVLAFAGISGILFADLVSETAEMSANLRKAAEYCVDNVSHDGCKGAEVPPMPDYQIVNY